MASFQSTSKVVNIQYFAVFHITFVNGHSMLFRVSMHYTDSCGLYSVPEVELGHN